MSARPQNQSAPVPARYGAALAAFCSSGAEDRLLAAYELAREALATQLTLAEFGSLHHQALRDLNLADGTTDQSLSRADAFFLEGMAVFDMAIRGYQTSLSALQAEIAERRRIEEELRDVTFELARQRDALDKKVQQRTAQLRDHADELEQKNRQLLLSNEEQAAFTAALSHDLKTPINSIEMFLDTALGDGAEDLSADAHQFVTIAAQTAGRMRQLVDDVLEYSQILEDAEPHGPVDLAQIVAQVLDQSGEIIAQRGAAVQVEPLPMVTGKARHIALLVKHLVANALLYSAQGQSAQVSISANPPDQNGYVQLTVADRGIGIAPEHQDRIFQLFSRLHTFESYQGSGVGLALCKRVAENHGPGIALQSKPGQGSRFSVAFKAAEPAQH